MESGILARGLGVGWLGVYIVGMIFVTHSWRVLRVCLKCIWYMLACGGRVVLYNDLLFRMFLLIM